MSKIELLCPNVDLFLHLPTIVNPPMCTLRELQDGTYSIDDLAMMHELLNARGVLYGSNNN